MKKLFAFLLYKMYNLAKAQNQTVNEVIGFVGFTSIFEGLHFVIIYFFLKNNFDVKIKLSQTIQQSSGWIFVVIGFSLNYFIFIKTKLIYRINDYYQAQKRVVWKDNLLFFAYIILLFVIIFIQ
jgi:hypothetical protein